MELPWFISLLYIWWAGGTEMSFYGLDNLTPLNPKILKILKLRKKINFQNFQSHIPTTDFGIQIWVQMSGFFSVGEDHW